MPGPFFSEAKVIRSYHMVVSWKDDNGWTPPINHAYQTFNHYKATFNPKYLNENRLERSLYEAVARRHVRKKNVYQSKEWSNLVQFVHASIINKQSDSVQITLILETPLNKDSVLISKAVKCDWDGEDQ